MAEKKKAGMNFERLRRSVAHHWKLAVLPAILVPVIIIASRDFLPRKYKASAEFFVQDSMQVNPFLEDMQVEWTVQSRLPLIQSVLRSRSTLEAVLVTLGEITEKSTEETRVAKVKGLREQIEIFGLGGGLVRIQFTGEQPERIHKGLSLLVDILIDTMLRPQKQSLEEAGDFLDQQLGEVRASLSDIEDKIQTFRQENVEELPEIFSVNMTSYLDAQQALMRASTELRAARQRRANLEQRLKIYNPIARELEGKLIEERARLGELKSVYNDNHPSVMASEMRIRELQRQRSKANIKAEELDMSSLESAARVQTGVRSGGSHDGSSVTNQTSDIVTSDLLEYKALSAEIASLRGTVTELKKQSGDTLDSVKSFAATERGLKELMRDYEVKQNIYTTLLERYEDAKVTRALSLYDEQKQVWLIEEPRQPTQPVGFPLWLMAVAGFAGGLVFGVSAAILSDFISGALFDPEELEEVTGVAVVAVMPRLYAFKNGPTI